MAKAISMPNPLFAWSYWFLLWDQRLFLGLRLSWQKIYLMQKKVCYMSQVLRFDNVFLRPIFGFHRTSNCPFYSLETSCKALTKIRTAENEKICPPKISSFSQKKTSFFLNQQSLVLDLRLQPWLFYDYRNKQEILSSTWAYFGLPSSYANGRFYQVLPGLSCNFASNSLNCMPFYHSIYTRTVSS